ncbi:amidohydrolase [Parahaliea maris]|uniref:Amidohydrolase n=1 Tax=Parahaliea maris TaxID=2716870 RepID=A0A5C9A1W7_9GAMM|nr:amidohydrolase [Parahaliea maris]TXS93770.1 amidohydrolase [Parahaliea maris]
MKRKFLPWGLAALTSLSGSQAFAEVPADRVFYGDHIITMDSTLPSAEAVAIRGDRIVYVGDRAGAGEFVGADTQALELGDKALVPGLIDSHGHVTGSARLIDYVNASSPPVGTSENIADILELLKERLKTNPPPEGGWLVAYGYDDSLLAENRHPTRHDLDKVSADVPIYMSHVSGHLGTANSAALAAAGITEDTPNPPGGVIRRERGGKVPNGVVEETANYLFRKALAATSAGDSTKFERQLKEAVQQFASYGITTIQDGAAQMADVAVMRKMAAAGEIEADIVAIPFAMTGIDFDEVTTLVEEGYQGGVRVGGVKFVLDGSPQGRTAWTTKPYNENPHGVEGPYTAYSTVVPNEFKAQANDLLHRGVPIYMHGNGDAAIDLAMDAVGESFDGEELPDHRSVIIHAQLMRPDQVVRAAELDMVPSFYSAHSFFWGDWHRQSFGDERAFHISPAQSALQKGVHFTIHNDTPVVPPDMMRLMWIAVNRETRNGVILGEDQVLSPYDALYAMTLGGAYQYFEEDSKGSLTVGKQADLAVLGADPLEVDPKTIKDIPVLETISRGKTIFQR